MIHPVKQKELPYEVIGGVGQVFSNHFMQVTGLIPAKSPECVYVKKNDCILSVHTTAKSSNPLLTAIEQLEIQVHNMRKGK